MSLCPHGYTAFWDCPECDCPGCGEKWILCRCHAEASEPRARRDEDHRLDDPRHGQADGINRSR